MGSSGGESATTAPCLLVGDGRLARHLAHYFDLLGVPRRGWSRNDGVEALAERAEGARVVLLLISDDALVPFVREHDEALGSAPRIHCSGATRVAGVQRMHPLGSFGETLHPEELYRSIVFAVEPGEHAFDELFPELPNRHVRLEESDRLRYHTAAVLGGNFSAMLWREAAKTFRDLGLPREAWTSYLRTVTGNLLHDPEGAVTGPVARRDAGTVAAHLETLGDDPWAGVYRAMLATEGMSDPTLEPDAGNRGAHPGSPSSDRDPFAPFTDPRGPIVATTAYDASTARILAGEPIDFLLVGDSVAMVVYGHRTTRAATVDMLARHVTAVRAGAPDTTIVADLPWIATRTPEAGRVAARRLLEAGADAVKLEALPDHAEVLDLLRRDGISVMGHVGLLPQLVEEGEYRVAGRGAAAEAVRDAAKLQEEAGCFALVVECVPADLGARITRESRVPTIGIGAGPDTDGQILVVNDLAGLTPGRLPRFVRTFGDAATPLAEAVRRYARAVRAGTFPSEEESYR